MFYLRHSSGLQGYFTNTNPPALSREIYFYCSIFRVRRYCAVLLILELKPPMLRYIQLSFYISTNYLLTQLSTH